MEDLSKYEYKSLLITGLGTFIGTLDSSIVNVSLPTIIGDFGTTVGVVGWVVLSYALAVFPLLIIFGAMSEKNKIMLYVVVVEIVLSLVRGRNSNSDRPAGING